LFEPGQVVDRNPGQPGELFSAQPRRAAASANREADRRRPHAIAPVTNRPTEFRRLHLATARDADGIVLALAVLRKPDDWLTVRRRPRLVATTTNGEP
jgi:hypothetical protein